MAAQRDYHNFPSTRFEQTAVIAARAMELAGGSMPHVDAIGVTPEMDVQRIATIEFEQGLLSGRFRSRLKFFPADASGRVRIVDKPIEPTS